MSTSAEDAPLGAPSEVPYRQMIEKMPVPLVVVSDARLIHANEAAQHLLDATAPTDLIGKLLLDFVHPMDHVRIQNRLRRLDTPRTANPPTDVRVVTLRGTVHTLSTTSMTIPYGAGHAILIMVTDHSEHDRAHHELRESERNFRRLFESMQDVYYRTDAAGVVVMVGPGVRRVLGYEPHEIVGKTAEAFYPKPEHRDALKKALRTHGEVADFEGQMVRRDGRIIDISISSHALYDEQGQFAGVEGIYRDITERKSMERKLRRLATTDYLTGIANRRAFLEHAARAFKRCQRHNAHMALFIIDLDHFKSVNDRHGHIAGDLVLIRFVAATRLELRATDLFGRLGGEEFALVVHDAALEVAQRITERTRVLRFESDDGSPYQITVSIGGTRNRPEDTGIERLLDRADKALYEAKHSGRDRVVWRA
ncbi:MAG TPA: sensor domain-containing diguanylate cyclase [Acidiferrobacteraceae bacterium]|nr:sensor domain-containing diguanylate cyclase [Acidiferrobacteraceae bacterium]